MNKVTPKNVKGNLINPTKNPEVSSIRVESRTNSIIKGFVKSVYKSAFVHGKAEALASLGWVDGQAVEGQIVVTETMKAPAKYAEESKKINSDIGIAYLVDGAPIYTSSQFTTDMTMSDTLIEATNLDEHNAAYKELEAAKEEANL